MLAKDEDLSEEADRISWFWPQGFQVPPLPSVPGPEESQIVKGDFLSLRPRQRYARFSDGALGRLGSDFQHGPSRRHAQEFNHQFPRNRADSSHSVRPRE